MPWFLCSSKIKILDHNENSIRKDLKTRVCESQSIEKISQLFFLFFISFHGICVLFCKDRVKILKNLTKKEVLLGNAWKRRENIKSWRRNEDEKFSWSSSKEIIASETKLEKQCWYNECWEYENYFLQSKFLLNR